MTTNLFRGLSDEWTTTGSDRSARSALMTWAERTPALAPFDTLGDVVTAAQTRGDPRRSNLLLSALLTHVGDGPLAARAVLQAVLPGLAGVARRARWTVGGPLGLWETLDQLDQDVVTFGYERISNAAGCSSEWPATTIVDGTWRRIRTLTDARRRERLRERSLEEAPQIPAGPDRPAADDLAVVILDAVRAGVLRQADAGVVYSSRVLGHSPADLARWAERDVRAVRKQRDRAERTLMAWAS